MFTDSTSSQMTLTSNEDEDSDSDKDFDDDSDSGITNKPDFVGIKSFKPRTNIRYRVDIFLFFLLAFYFYWFCVVIRFFHARHNGQ